MSRLTEEMVIARSKQSDLGNIKKLNCWGSDLTDVNIITRMRNVEVLALSVNKIASLSPFENCPKLQELYLRRNDITDINEISHLQSLPLLKYLWLDENPCCDIPNYRAIVLRALPNLKKLDNVEVTQQEVDEAIRGNTAQTVVDEDIFEDAYEAKGQQQQQQEHYYQQQLAEQQRQQQQSPQQHSPQQKRQQSPQLQQQQQLSHQQQRRRSSSPCKEPPQQLVSPIAANNDGVSGSVSELNSSNQNSKPPTPTKEPVHPPSPMYNTSSNSMNPKENRLSFHQINDGSPEQESSPHMDYRERSAQHLPPSISTQSMKEYYQSDRPAHPLHYRHSQTDLTEWDEHHQHPQSAGQNPYGSQLYLIQQRRSAGNERGPATADRYAYRNGTANGDWEDAERPRTRGPNSRFNDSMSTVSASVMGHFCHRRPVNRNSNILSAALCLVKELDYNSLEVMEHAVRCRIDELSAE